MVVQTHPLSNLQHTAAASSQRIDRPLVLSFKRSSVFGQFPSCIHYFYAALSHGAWAEHDCFFFSCTGRELTSGLRRSCKRQAATAAAPILGRHSARVFASYRPMADCGYVNRKVTAIAVVMLVALRARHSAASARSPYQWPAGAAAAFNGDWPHRQFHTQCRHRRAVGAASAAVHAPPLLQHTQQQHRVSRPPGNPAMGGALHGLVGGPAAGACFAGRHAAHCAPAWAGWALV